MTNQTISDSAQPVSSQGVPTPEGGAASGQPNSSGEVTLTAGQWQQVTELIEKRVQGTHDKRIQELQDQIAALKQPPASVPPTPQSQAQAVSLANGATQAAQPPVDYLAPIRALGLDANDAEVLALMVQHKDNVPTFKASLVDLKAQRATQPPPNAAAVLASSQGVAQSGKPDLSTITDPNELYQIAVQQGWKLPGPPKRQ